MTAVRCSAVKHTQECFSPPASGDWPLDSFSAVPLGQTTLNSLNLLGCSQKMFAE